MKNLSEKIKQLREDFLKGSLDEKDCPDNPFELFCAWLDDAVQSEVPEVQAMTLATCNKEGKPSARIVYLREFEHHQFYFYGNYGSRKAMELEENPHAALLFFWPDLERQIRIEGMVNKAPDGLADAYFNARPRESKIGSWASEQSRVLGSREELEKRVAEYERKFSGKEIPRPEWWGGWVLKADYYEFWQGRKSRLHDRICYRMNGDVWKRYRIFP
ncbi:MAG: pyridoxamine 5'-phosphate oxidase [Bacteroidia bacterium]|nr:pyridoxamine 5'-phosphate oxidase [Bacteroidia bacterium]